MAAVEQGAALRLIADGQVTADQRGSVFFLADLSPDVVGELRVRAALAIDMGLAYRDADGKPGVFPVRLTPYGETLLARCNPADYASAQAWSVRDGQVGVTEVAR